MPRGNMQQLREAVAGAPSIQQAAREAAEANPPEPSPAPPPEDEPKPEPTEPEKSAEPSEQAIDRDEVVLGYVNDLPDVLGVDPEAFYGLPLRLSDDGEEVPFGEIKDRLQDARKREAELERQQNELRVQQQQLRQQAAAVQQAQQKTTERFAKAQQEMALAQADAQAKAASWEQRKLTEPGRVSLEQMEAERRVRNAQTELQAAHQEQTHLQSQFKAHLTQQAGQILAEKWRDDWTDEGKRKQLQSDIVQFATGTYGFAPQELAEIIDPRTLMVLRDAMEGRRLREQGTQRIEEMRKVAPRVPKGLRIKGAPTGKAKVSSDEVAERVQNARRTRRKQHITEAARGVIAQAIAEGKR